MPFSNAVAIAEFPKTPASQERPFAPTSTIKNLYDASTTAISTMTSIHCWQVRGWRCVCHRWPQFGYCHLSSNRRATSCFSSTVPGACNTSMLYCNVTYIISLSILLPIQIRMSSSHTSSWLCRRASSQFAEMSSRHPHQNTSLPYLSMCDSWSLLLPHCHMPNRIQQTTAQFSQIPILLALD